MSLRQPMHRRLVSLALLVVMGGGLVACGQTLTPASGIGAPGATAATGTLAAGTPTPNASPARPTPDAVTVTLDGSQYTSGAVVVATILNGLPTTIVATDHQSECTMVQVQRNVNGGWVVMNRCLEMTLTRMIPLAAGSATVVRLAPRAEQSTAASWPAGAYRIAFSYFTGTVGEPGAGTTVYSATFTVA
ncbi:MAG TPA: hypothetical protein VGN32_06915 [Ktedonobacterales bacterium]|nr:hypothetical protein [Ktedonobacterales bacterium]